MARAPDQFFDEAGSERVRQAVVEAESLGDFKILPVAVHQSSRYERAADLLGLYLALVASLALMFAYGEKGQRSLAEIPLYVVVATQLLAFLLGSMFLARIDALRFFLAGRAQMSQRVQRAAEQTFVNLAAHGEKRVLLYVSLLERQVVILADPAVQLRLRPNAWNEIRDALLKGMAEGKAADGMCAAIALCGGRLSGSSDTAGDAQNRVASDDGQAEPQPAS